MHIARSLPESTGDSFISQDEGESYPFHDDIKSSAFYKVYSCSKYAQFVQMAVSAPASRQPSRGREPIIFDVWGVHGGELCGSDFC